MNFVQRATGKLKRMVDPPHAFLKGRSRLLHVGGNVGQERTIYDRLGLEVLWVKPIPSVFEELSRNIALFPRQRAVQALVTDRAGQTHRFNVANNNGRSSSILPLGQQKDIWPEIDFCEALDLTSTTVDQMAADSGLSFDALMIDVQGAELLVLKGATETLRSVEVIGAEAADFEIYKGCTTVDELKDHLGPLGFRLDRQRLVTPHPAGGACYDLVFRKVRESRRSDVVQSNTA